ncbi:MAG: ABC transporter permease, partial [Acidobacteria bacterium]|nr:ABC transporter permease [Acidobacteriota bacterium]
QGFHAIMNLVLFPLWMVSGALFPIDKASVWMQWVMLANPMTYALAALRRLMEHGATPAAVPGLERSLLITAACAVLLMAASTAVANRQRSRSFA